MPLPQTELIRRLKAYQQRQHMTQNALADSIGIDRSTLSKMLRGKHTPHADTLHAIADSLGWDTGDVFRWSAELALIADLVSDAYGSAEGVARARREQLSGSAPESRRASLRRARRIRQGKS